MINIEEMSNLISNIFKQTMAGTEEVAAATEQQTACQVEVLSSSVELSEMSMQLQNTVLKFKL